MLGNIVGSILVPNHNWMADTVSNLAAGQYEIIQDIALYAYAGTLICCALGAAHFHLDGTRWNLGIACLTLLAMLVVIIGARNEYGDGDKEGLVLHMYIVYAIGFLFAALFVLMANGLAQRSRYYQYISYGCLLLWLIGAPAFFLVPTEYDGAFERLLGLVQLTWVGMFSRMLIRVSRSLK